MADPVRASVLRRAVAAAAPWLAALVLWVSLVLPDQPDQLGAAALLRVPAEVVVLVAMTLVLRGRVRTWVAAVAGVVIAVVTLVKILDIGLLTGFYRTFDPLTDPGYLGSGWGVLRDSVGTGAAVLITAAAVLGTVGLLIALPAASVRLSRAVSRHRRPWAWVAALLALVWVGSAGLQVQVPPGLPVAAADTSTVAVTHVQQVRDGLRDRAAFDQAAAQDPYATLPAGDLLTGLRGRDVVLVFVESYGRVALQDPQISPPVTQALDRASSRLGAAGFGARSAFLTSPTFGGLSWLAHSTLQTGLQVSDQIRYNAVISGSRLTLASAFQRAGWRTVLVSPADDQDFAPASTFYRYDTVYDARNLGYAGPAFGYAPVPDQFTLTALAHRELKTAGRTPLFAEVNLISSHIPWAPLPRLVDPSTLGDGSVLRDVLAAAPPASEVWRDTAGVRAAYAESVAYALDSLTAFVETAHDDNLVLVMLGDHQPSSVVSGADADHDVPITVVANDPAVLDRISGWGWQPGWRPGPTASVWPMADFRDRFLTAFGS